MTAKRASLDDLKIDRSAAPSSRGQWLVGLLVILLLAGAGGAWAWMNRTPVADVRTASVREDRGSAASAGTVLNASGYVTARRRATVSSKMTGKVMEVRVDEGMVVKQGQILARLDDTTIRASLALTRAQLESARKAEREIEVRIREAQLNRDRMRTLVKEGITSQSMLDTALAEVESLEARLQVAREQVSVAQSEVALQQTQLDDTIIRAPFSGVAISRDAQAGEMVSPVSAGGGFTRTGISTIVDMASLEIEVDVNESYINRVRPNQKVEATLDAYPDWQIPAHVITTVPTADRQKATVLVRIGFDKPGDPRILPDMGVKVAFLEDAPVPGAPVGARLLVPKPAVRTISNQTVVFVIAQDHAERRAVRVGPTKGDETEVLSGLTAGERVIVEGPADLADGMKIVEVGATHCVARRPSSKGDRIA